MLQKASGREKKSDAVIAKTCSNTAKIFGGGLSGSLLKQTTLMSISSYFHSLILPKCQLAFVANENVIPQKRRYGNDCLREKS